MGMLPLEEVDAMYETFKNAPAIIFDLRNYPLIDIKSLCKHFFPSPISSAIIYRPALTFLPNPYHYYYLPGWYYLASDQENLLWSNPDPYSGKVYILVYEGTQSGAEHFCQYLSYHPNARVIGTQTAGADGDMSCLDLPSGIRTCFTSLGWYYADGYQQQRNGVKIDTVVSPTIEGIRHGRDEILEAALDCQTSIDHLAKPDRSITIYPNPASDGQFHITIALDNTTDLTLSLLNLAGKIIRQQIIKCATGYNHLLFSTQNITSGLYVLRIQNGQESWNVKVAIKNNSQ
jgi:hypothetical protein